VILFCLSVDLGNSAILLCFLLDVEPVFLKSLAVTNCVVVLGVNATPVVVLVSTSVISELILVLSFK